MPRPSDQVVNIPPEELRVVLSPSGEMTMWVPIFAEQPNSTIVHADGTVLCRGGPFYHEELQRAYAAYLERKAKEPARWFSAPSEPASAAPVEPPMEPKVVTAEPAAPEPVVSEPVVSEPVVSEQVATRPAAPAASAERSAVVRPKVVRPTTGVPSDKAPSR